eukprot:11187272-Lingulodinium_polyedra.AAC.1
MQRPRPCLRARDIVSAKGRAFAVIFHAWAKRWPARGVRESAICGSGAAIQPQHCAAFGKRCRVMRSNRFFVLAA